ncbi:uncharacterized protein [Chelonus insularis]|uniref:uncharacterized protein n=1 Tax=Chelonus insularis TaxID=460826 RepID=UPI00158DE93B|nr:uncharacterized protein LOC118074939 [Chelonus insularis]
MDMQRINGFLCNPVNSNLLTEFFHSCINEVSNYSSPTFQQFANIGWTEDEYEFFHQLTISLLKEPTICCLDREKISPQSTNYAIDIPEELLNCVKTRLSHITDTLIINYSQKYMPILTDFDWRVHVVMGSSSVASIRQPLLQLDLKIKDQNLERIEKLEMNEEELEHFIKVLESTE